MGKAEFTKTLIQLSLDLAWGNPAPDSAGSMVELMVNTEKAYAEEYLPGLLLPLTMSPC